MKSIFTCIAPAYTSDDLSAISLSKHTIYEVSNSFTGADEQGRRQINN